MLSFEPTPYKDWQLGVKRVVDVVGAMIAMVLFSPLLLICAALIKLTSKGSVFLRWRVIGKDGRRITSYKFRTMVQDAEKLEQELRSKAVNEMDGVYFKLREDFRITPIGKVLRKFSIDELPSIYSVLKGDLSLVGPRPVRMHEYEALND